MISLVYSNTDQRGDFVRTGGGNLDTDEGLETALTISLFTDARAKASDDVDPGIDPRGWWGAAFLDDVGQYGSRLWLLKRAKLTDATLLQAVGYAKECTAWLVKQRIASEIIASAERMTGKVDVGLLSLTVQRPRRSSPRVERKWEVQFGL